MPDVQRSISLRDLKWDDVDVFARKHGFKDRSPFVEYCIGKTIHSKKLSVFYTVFVLLLLCLIMVILTYISLRV